MLFKLITLIRIEKIFIMKSLIKNKKLFRKMMETMEIFDMEIMKIIIFVKIVTIVRLFFKYNKA